MAGDRERTVVRSYRLVLDKIERRVYRFDRWRLPTPHGVALRSVGYFLGALAVLLIASGLPVAGLIVGAIPPPVRWVALPGVCAWALSQWEIDGRAPHRALLGVIRWWLRPRCLAGLRACPRPGGERALVQEAVIAPAGDESRYRRGRVRGPAKVTLRYPCRVELEGVALRAGRDPQERLRRARRLRVRPKRGGPLVQGKELRIPAGKEVVFE